MRKPGPPFFLFLCACLALFISQTSPSASEAIHEVKDLNENWAERKDGKEQSPIDVNSDNIQVNQSIGSLITSYDISHAIMQKNSHVIMVNWTEGAGSLLIDGKAYVLGQCQWHLPSEHKLLGERYPLELHMVHRSSDGDIAVISIMYQFGPPDPFLFKLMKFVAILVTNDVVPAGLVPPPVIEIGAPYYRYMGSLTTPPCTEGVIWSLIQEARFVSKGQVRKLRSALHRENNARPIQPINGRAIFLYKPWAQEEHMKYLDRENLCRKSSFLKWLLCHSNHK
ncbi:alpha carbonic anhydrase 7-like isoform X1 [Phoenix dactylifera]|uniref:Carbonic anhydrase n=1 Tax=Phoenix dactylifera TaxID=42345 RepID=A0A8B8ZDZ8_PHODC|nr:alpha carbonic anhydrase 7-like isoform X1 [Phoenix dactylifera]